MNVCSYIGRITRDLDLQYTNSNKAVLKFGIAVDRKFKTEGQPTADFINCIAWGKPGEIIAQYMTKGSKIGISGRTQTGSYDNADGKKVYTSDVIVESFDFLDSKKAVNEDSEPVNNNKDDGFYPVSEDDELPF